MYFAQSSGTPFPVWPGCLIWGWQTSMAEAYREPFDIALGLHACGNATDYAMLAASQHRAAYVMCPCCVGKLKFSLAGGSSFHANHSVYTPRMPGWLFALCCHCCGGLFLSLGFDRAGKQLRTDEHFIWSNVLGVKNWSIEPHSNVLCHRIAVGHC